MSGLMFIAASFAVWRITHMIREEQGPFDILAKFRKIFIYEHPKLGTQTRWFFGELINCFLCLSVWIATPFAFFLTDGWINIVTYLLAFSGVAIFLNLIFSEYE